MKKNKHLKAHIIQVVNNQLKNNDPPETKITYERLLNKGYSEQEAKELIGTVVTTEIYDTLKQMKPFNESRFVSRLKQLPDTSFLESKNND